MLSKLREPVNGLTHLGGAILGFFGMIVLLIFARGEPVKVVSVLVYGLGLMAMFSASGIYHSAMVKPVCPASPEKNRRKGAAEGRKTAVPFGPFLALGAIVAVFVGPQLVDVYVNHILH